MQKYDCLTPEQLMIAKQAPTPEEEASVQFNRAIPRGRDAGVIHNFAHRLIGVITRLVMDSRHTSSRVASALSSLRKPEIGKLAWNFSTQTTGLWSEYRFLHLYRLITKVKPETVVEFGSGVSTVLIAKIIRLNYLRSGVKGKLFSYEQSPNYYQKYVINFPKELREYADIQLKPVALDWFGQYRGIYYQVDDFPKKVDFVYIDGATRSRGCPECDFPYRRLNADIVRMNSGGTSIKMAITDHRYANYPFYIHELSSRYEVKLSHLWRSIIITPR